MKKHYFFAAFLASLLSIPIYLNFAEDKKILQVEVLRDQHQLFLENSPFKETQKLSREDRKLQGLPPNSYNERLWDLTLDPVLGRPANERLLKTQKTLREADALNGGSQRLINFWEERGPANLGGRTRAILFDPNDVGNTNSSDDYTRVFAGGVSGGLWVNEDITDANSPWTLVSGLAANISVTTIIADPNDPAIMYIGSGESYTSGNTFGQGVWKSTDAGVTWSHIFGEASGTYSSSNQIINGIFYINDIIARNNAGSTELYIAVAGAFHSYSGQFHSLNDQGVYKSSDGGSNWTKFTINETNGSPSNPNDIELDINNNIWVTTTRSSYGPNGGKILKSTDGLSFNLVHTISDVRRTEIEPSQSDANKFWLVVSTIQSDGSTQADIYTTADAFSTVTQITTEPSDVDNGISATDYTRGQSFYDLEIEADAASNLIVGGIDLFRSTDNGASWSQISKWSNNNNLSNLGVSLVHADHHGTFFRPGVGNSNKVVFTTDGGIYYCDDITQASTADVISERNKGYNTSQFYYGTIDESAQISNDDIAGGTQDNGTWTKLNGIQGVNTFLYTRGGDGAFTEFDDSGTYMVDSHVFNSHAIRTLPFDSNSITYFIASDDNLPGNSKGNFINEAVLDKSLDILYCNSTTTTDGFQIERNANILAGSATAVVRTQLSNALFNAGVSALKVSPFTTTSTKLYVGLQNGRLLRIDNANTATPTWNNIMGSGFVGSISDIEFGETENDIFVTMFNYGVTSVWFSNNAGVSWTSIEGNLPDIPVKCILQNPLRPSELIVGTMLGIWSTDNYTIPNPTWVQSYNGMRETAVFDLDLKASDNTILATTHGRGFFTTKFTSLGFNEPKALVNAIKLFPTVSKGQFTLTSSKTIGSTQIEIYSIAGKNVYETKVDIQQGLRKEFDLNLNPGMYLVKFKGSNFETTKRIIIQ